jgi:hypothetical protein
MARIAEVTEDEGEMVLLMKELVTEFFLRVLLESEPLTQ